MNYKVLASGSTGNCTILEDYIAIDMGAPFKTVLPCAAQLQLVLLTHEHNDHFKATTIRRLASERPTLRFGCGDWLVGHLLDCGVPAANIDVYEMDKWYVYGSDNRNLRVKPFHLPHNVPNCGYHVHIGDSKSIYATDTSSLNHVEARGYDLYLIEANHGEQEIVSRIKAKLEAGAFCYELGAAKNHLSKEAADDWLYANMGSNSVYVYLHQHVDEMGQQ